MLTSAYVKTRMPTQPMAGRTPFEAYYSQKPDLMHMRELGCQVFMLKQNDNP